MLKFFRTIRKKLIEHPSKGRIGDHVRKSLLFTIGKIMLVLNRIFRPVRLRPPTGWYGICLKSDVATKHIEELWQTTIQKITPIPSIKL